MRKINLWQILIAIVLFGELVQANTDYNDDEEDIRKSDLNYDSDFEYVDSSEAKVKFEVHEEAHFNRDSTPEMTHTHCITRDRERICDCGFTSQVNTYF